MEGVRHDSNSGSITYVKLHGGDIRLIWRSRNDPDGVAEYYDIKCIGDALPGRFRWRKNPAMRGFRSETISTPAARCGRRARPHVVLEQPGGLEHRAVRNPAGEAWANRPRCPRGRGAAGVDGERAPAPPRAPRLDDRRAPRAAPSEHAAPAGPTAPICVRRGATFW
ncbi:hypothetical protein SCE1572_49105 [Sorangium cellulosum So0157-2]|uniref:Uncharacterized protein n=1 Tax=Sorangium cellulosum So0157-2 TaxID=1254432 RepID=S4YBN0_SORCE|nr:hypothetical protein SCE1572_49105 [Sorangium cellulosum So0157-2]